MLKDTISRNDKEIEALRSASAMKTEQEMKTKLTLKQTTDDLSKANQIIATNNINYEQLKKKMNVVSKILLKLEKEHTNLQEQYENREQLFQIVQKTLETREKQIRQLEDENERLLRTTKTKDESISELRRLIDVQYKKIQELEVKENVPRNGKFNIRNSCPLILICIKNIGLIVKGKIIFLGNLIIPNLFPEWKPLPSPKSPDIIKSPVLADQQPASKNSKVRVGVKSQSARPGANTVPSSYFSQPTTTRNKTLSSRN